MSNSSNEIALALLATLEARARKKGHKSVVKQVAKRLRDAGAAADQISQVEAIGAARKTSGSATKPRGKTKTQARPIEAAQPAAWAPDAGRL